MIKTLGNPRPGMTNVLVCTDISALTDDHPVVDNYKDDKGNVITDGLPCGEPSIAIEQGTGTVAFLLNGAWA